MVDELPSIPADLGPAIVPSGRPSTLGGSPFEESGLRNFQCPRTRLGVRCEAGIPAPPPPLWQDVAAQGARNSAGGAGGIPHRDPTQGGRNPRCSRGSRGPSRGSLERRAHARRAAQSESGQRDAECRSGSESTIDFQSILAVIQEQGAAIQGLAASVAQMARAVNSFLFATHRSSAGTRLGGGTGRSAARASEELRIRSDSEWERVESQARAVLDSI